MSVSSFAGQPITDFTPRWAVRFDDGTSGQYPDILKFIRAGWNVDLLLNWSKIGDAGRLTVKDVLRLIREGELAGVSVMVTSHGNTDWTGLTDPFSFTDAQVAAELDFSDIVDTVGADNFSYGYIQSGNNETILNKVAPRIEQIMVDLGYEWAWGLWGDGTTSGTGYAANALYPGEEIVPSVDGTWRTARGQSTYFPGAHGNPMRLWGPGTVDLGSYIDHCGTWADTTGNGTADSWINDIRSGGRPLVFEQSGEGIVPAGPDLRDDWRNTTQYACDTMLGLGGDFCVALHGEGRSADLNPVLGVDFAGFNTSSYDHLLWLLDFYRGEGFMVPGTVREISQRACGTIPENSVVTPNTTLKLTQKNFPFLHEMSSADSGVENESVDFMNSTIAGWSTSGIAQPTWVQNTVGSIEAPGTAVANLCVLDPIGGFDFRDFNRTDGSHVFWEDEGGTLCPDDEAVCTGARLARDGLRPGRWRFSLDFFQPTSGQLIFTRVGAIGMRNYYLNSVEGNPDVVSVRKYHLLDGYGYDQFNPQDTYPFTWQYEFVAPADAIPQLDPSIADEDVGAAGANIAAGDTLVVNTRTVVNAIPGAKCVAIANEAAVDGVVQFYARNKLKLTAVVTALDTVTIYMTNTGAATPADDVDLTGAAYDVVSIAVFVEDLVFQRQVSQGQYTPAGEWQYHTGVTVSMPGARNEAQINNVKLTYLGET